MSNFYVGTQKPKGIYVGTSKVKALYLGTEKVWEVSGGRLPSEYQEVEWIASDGNQYIITDYYPTNQVEYEIDFQKVVSNPWCCVMSSNDSTFNLWNSGNWQLSTRPLGNINWYIERDRALLKFSPPNVYINDELKLTSQNALTTQTTPLHIFSAVGGNYKIGAKIWKLTFKDDGVLSADFVPCYHKQSGVIGMYDIVGGHFFTNAGSGTFTKGADV